MLIKRRAKLNAFVSQDPLHRGNTNSKLIRNVAGTSPSLITFYDTGSPRSVADWFSANLLRHQTANPLLPNTSPVARKSSIMDSEGHTDIAHFGESDFDQLDGAKAMLSHIVQRIGIEGRLIDKDGPIAIQIAKPNPAIDIHGILRQSQIQHEPDLRPCHPSPSRCGKRNKTPDINKTPAAPQEFPKKPKNPRVCQVLWCHFGHRQVVRLGQRDTVQNLFLTMPFLVGGTAHGEAAGQGHGGGLELGVSKETDGRLRSPLGSGSFPRLSSG